MIFIHTTNKHEWILQDVFTKATPVKSGIGMLLLQKMGWKEGEGLGRNKEGNKEPIKLDVKVDRKGQYHYLTRLKWVIGILESHGIGELKIQGRESPWFCNQAIESNENIQWIIENHGLTQIFS